MTKQKELIEELKADNSMSMTAETYNTILELFDIPLPEVVPFGSYSAIWHLIAFLLEGKIEAQEKIKELEKNSYYLKRAIDNLKKELTFPWRGTVLLPKECEEYVEKLNAMSEEDRRAFLNGTWTNTTVEDPYDSEEVK